MLLFAGMTETKPRSIFDTPPDAATEARLDAEAEANCAAGRVVPHERAREWLARLAKGEKVPPPAGWREGVLYRSRKSP